MNSYHIQKRGRLGFIAILCMMAIFFSGQAQAKKYNLKMNIQAVKIKVNDKLSYTEFAYNGQVPGPLIHVKEGDDVTVSVTNLTELPHTIHWHGIYHRGGNWKNDGVPDINQKAIAPGETYTYHFIAEPSGTLWYHCHVNVNEHVAYRGMWGALIIDPKNPTELEKKVTKDHILMFSEYASAFKDKPGFGGTPTDVIDYYGLNGRAFPNTMPIRVEKGDVVRLRLFGAGGGTHYLHTHGHSFLVTHKDGFPLPQPYEADTIAVGPGERYDLIYTADNPGIFIMHDHVDMHVTNDGKYPGGVITVMEYKGIKPQPFYPWKDIKYDPDFFFQESLQKYGLIEQPNLRGEVIKKKRRRRSR